MHLVTPKVWLISMPSIDFDAMREYLEDVGGESWLDRVEGTMEPADLLAEFAGRSCYRSWEPGLNPNVTRVRDDSQEYIRNILSSAHGSVAEHPSFGFMVRHGSRIFTHEMVRHRAGVAISQESMRYVRLDDIPMWFPEWAQKDPVLMDRLTGFVQESEQLISWMSKRFGFPRPGARPAPHPRHAEPRRGAHEGRQRARGERGVSVNWLVNNALDDFLSRLLPPDKIRLTHD